MKNNVIAVFFDSNALFSENCFDYSKSWIIQRMEVYSDLVEYADVYGDVLFVISDVVVQEIHRAQCEKYKNKTDDLKRIILPNWKYEHNLDALSYKAWLENHFEKHCDRGAFGMAQFVVAPIPDDCFKSVVDRVLEKRAPFEGKGKASDKGFKDALIWETLLRYKRDNIEDEIVLITNDSRMSDKSIQKEFEEEFDEAITICSDPEDFQKFLNAFNEERGVDAGLPLVEIEDSGRVNEFFRNVVFYNMEAIAEVGNLSYQDDTTYNLKRFHAKEDGEELPKYVSTLWSTDSRGDSAHCEIEFNIIQVKGRQSLLCLVSGCAVEVEYDEADLEAIGYAL